MKKRGFTLTEVIISVTILVSIGLIVVLGLNKMFDQSKSEDKLSFEDKIISSADLYLLNNQNLMNELQTERGYITVTVGELMNAGFLDSNLVDPETNEVILESKLVRVSLDSDGLYKIEYQPEIINEPYLDARTLNLTYGIAFDCTKKSSYQNEWRKTSLRPIDDKGFLMNIGIDEVIKDINCDVDTNKPGNYTIEYIYQIPPMNVTKSYKRNVIVSQNPNDIVNLYASAEFVSSNPNKPESCASGTPQGPPPLCIDPYDGSSIPYDPPTTPMPPPYYTTTKATVPYTTTRPYDPLGCQCYYDPYGVPYACFCSNDYSKDVPVQSLEDYRNNEYKAIKLNQATTVPGPGGGGGGYWEPPTSPLPTTVPGSGGGGYWEPPTSIPTTTAPYNPTGGNAFIINDVIIINVKGEKVTGEIVDLNINDYEIVGDYSTSSVGSKKATITYKGENSNGAVPTTELSFSVVYDPDDIVGNLQVTTNKTEYIINDLITFTVKGTRRGGGTRILDPCEYITPSNANTNFVGTITPTFTYNAFNSDGKKPKGDVSYTVKYDPEDIIDIRITGLKNSYCVNANASYKVEGKKRGTNSWGTLSSSLYTITPKISTSSSGSKSVLVKLIKANSDKSKPEKSYSYQVNNCMTDLRNCSQSCSCSSWSGCGYYEAGSITGRAYYSDGTYKNVTLSGSNGTAWYNGFSCSYSVCSEGSECGNCEPETTEKTTKKTTECNHWITCITKMGSAVNIQVPCDKGCEDYGYYIGEM